MHVFITFKKCPHVIDKLLILWLSIGTQWHWDLSGKVPWPMLYIAYYILLLVILHIVIEVQRERWRVWTADNHVLQYFVSQWNISRFFYCKTAARSPSTNINLPTEIIPISWNEPFVCYLNITLYCKKWTPNTFL